ncbi:MAG TPA: cobalamin-dependent protein [Thermoanaerobaculia bacterium]|nr:cobalamin-dependent protein [Thermoanaerobaculia bacterium]
MYREMREAVVQGDAPRARRLAEGVVDADGDLVAAIEQGFAAGIRKVGDLWEEGEYFLPELVQGAEAMKAAMGVLQPALRKSHGGQVSKGRVVIGTVQGDLHDIGKTLVATLLSAGGFEVDDLGSDVSVDRFLARAKENGADIIAASALLTTTMPVQKAIADGIPSLGLAPRPRLLVGGAPTTAAWAAQIGAAWAENALRAVAVAESLANASRRA